MLEYPYGRGRESGENVKDPLNVDLHFLSLCLRTLRLSSFGEVTAQPYYLGRRHEAGITEMPFP